MYALGYPAYSSNISSRSLTAPLCRERARLGTHANASRHIKGLVAVSAVLHVHVQLS